MKKVVSILIFSTALMAVLLVNSCQSNPNSKPGNGGDGPAVNTDTLRYPAEIHLKNVRQLTFGGNNAEAYFSFDNKWLVFQSDNPEWGLKCDQIFYMDTDGTDRQMPTMLSTGKGRTTCSYFMPGNKQVIYASTHAAEDTCPAVPPRVVGGKYVWPIYDTYDIYAVGLDGKNPRPIVANPGYDAEPTVSPTGDKIIFTSTRSGDLELWTMNIDGSDLKQITDELGYDGGAFFSPDGTKIVWRASRPKTEEKQKAYKDLLNKGLVQPADLEVFIADADGSNKKQVTNIGKANWAPYWHPSGEKIIFASNHLSEKGRRFNIFTVNLDGTELEQITFDEGFDAFPMFSFDGKYLVFSSNRFNGGGRDTNVFIAEWVD